MLVLRQMVSNRAFNHLSDVCTSSGGSRTHHDDRGVNSPREVGKGAIRASGKVTELPWYARPFHHQAELANEPLFSSFPTIVKAVRAE